MTRDILLEHPGTGAVKPIRPGFDWILFLFSGVLGLPLFLQGLPIWGAIFVALWVADLAIVWLGPESWRLPAQAVIAATFFALQLWLGFFGRGLIVKAYLARGWRKRDRARTATPKPRRDRKRPP